MTANSFNRIALTLVALGCFLSSPVSAQRVNPWAPAPINNMPPVESLTDGVWLKGELHLHSDHSTDSSNNPVSKIVAFCESVGMDFVAITDHDNHKRGDVANNTWADPDFKQGGKVLLLWGAEMTTTRGHVNVFSATPYDHLRLYDARDQRDIVVQSIKNGLGVQLSANHPSGSNNYGYSYDMVESIEVWNSVMWPKNANANMIWDDMLDSGRKLTGRGGSDAHHGEPDSPDKAVPNTRQRAGNYIGTPTNWVFVKEPTIQGVLDAIENGRLSVSANPYCPRIEFYADTDGDGTSDMMMGDNAVSEGKPVKFTVKLTGKTEPGATYTVKVVTNGQRSGLGPYEMKAENPVVEFTATPRAEGRTYYRIVVEGPVADYPEVPAAKSLAGEMLGLSNPICFNYDPNF
jgi:hypothetical protein